VNAEAGDIWLADVGRETRQHVVVVSRRRFHDLSGRALIIPQIDQPSATTGSPWTASFNGATYRADHVRSIGIDRLLERRDRLPADVTQRLRSAIRSVI
jgi:mRNA-degrading endonuclease toxin of MazEF toxin-antitoxin module